MYFGNHTYTQRHRAESDVGGQAYHRDTTQGHPWPGVAHHDIVLYRNYEGLKDTRKEQEDIMTTITAYRSNDATIHQKKSDALLQDAQKVANEIADRLYNQGSDAHHALVKNLIRLADKEISPRRLQRMYSKLWRARLAFVAALEEEQHHTTQEA